jgi:Ca2+-binding EF-hand superfamily protein
LYQWEEARRGVILPAATPNGKEEAMKRILLTSSILAVGLGSAAFAEDQQAAAPDGGSSFCAAEYSPGAKQSGDEAASSGFAAMDTDDDGMVSEAEFAACLNAAAGMESAEADRTAENMPEADSDASGTVSRDEYMTAAEGARAVAAKLSEATGGPVLVLRRYIFLPVSAADADVRGMSAHETVMRAEWQFNALDTDNNDEIGAEEWQKLSTKVPDMSDALAASFARLDEDGSGGLDEVEYLEIFTGKPDEAQPAAAETKG